MEKQSSNDKRLMIQPNAASETSRLPYPYYVDQQENVLRQDFWKGKPLKFLCFENQKTKEMVMLSKVWSDESMLKEINNGEYFPAFQDANGDMYTMTSVHGFTFTIRNDI